MSSVGVPFDICEMARRGSSNIVVWCKNTSTQQESRVSNGMPSFFFDGFASISLTRLYATSEAVSCSMIHCTVFLGVLISVYPTRHHVATESACASL